MTAANINPIVPGFYPDPSVCRAGDDYYLVTSSFEYFPGVPVFHSRDLVQWEQVGNVLDRPSQLNVRPGREGASAGIYAPTVRYHDGEFWLATTNREDVMKGHIIVRASDPAGEWSEPVYTTGAIGIDPDLAWDEDGTCYLTWSLPGGIAQATVDPSSGKVLSEPRIIFEGTGLAHTEGPHLIRRGSFWYLLVAEGGTGPGHGICVARSDSPSGPWEQHTANPILSHRSTTHPVQNTGHGDLVELPDGSWAMVHLGVRPRGSFPECHVNGRETFLTGVDWVDGWPVIVEDRFDVPQAPTAFADDFSTAELHPRWIAPGTDPRSFAVPHPGEGLRLSAGRAPAAREAERLLAVRARDASWTATATLPQGHVALVVRIDDAHWAAVERRDGILTARAVIGPLDQILATADGGTAEHPLALRAVAHNEQYSFAKGPDEIELGHLVDGEFRTLATIDGRYLSTEVAGGFTGRVIGVEALGTDALLTHFTYDPQPVPPAPKLVPPTTS
ncbi:glycoside hydrolase family 43 protein [Streptomyces violaceusniger]|uniref:Glycoside hydrolase family 43 n=1 Tax=Streptomyces violaceusniger (strain Tu 4113) TaxID=653045 RepID=G2P4X5_STRV4|nr:glycoside hydrolase family 43 protein [Streptomyces violaceusniger]AEM84152.1 glycoside hydrolase family 43 [Streptomyces violaceusniger Tu 4113]